jgi:hypothetical protein
MAVPLAVANLIVKPPGTAAFKVTLKFIVPALSLAVPPETASVFCDAKQLG